MDRPSTDWIRQILRVLGIAFSLLVIAIVVVPVFLRANVHHKPGYVVGVYNRPVSGAHLVFHDLDGKRITVVTDGEGRFRIPGLRYIASTAEGDYVLGRCDFQSGPGNTYVFSRRGSQEIVIRDARGKRVPNLPLVVTPTHRMMIAIQPGRYPPTITVRTNRDGVVRWDNTTAAERFQIATDSDARYVVDSVQTTVRGTAVHYDVTVIPVRRIDGTSHDQGG